MWGGGGACVGGGGGGGTKHTHKTADLESFLYAIIKALSSYNSIW